MIPARRLLWAGAALLLFALAASFESALQPMWRTAAILVLLVMLGDAAFALIARMPAASRNAPASFPLGIWHRISLRLHDRALHLSFHQHRVDGLAHIIGGDHT